MGGQISEMMMDLTKASPRRCIKVEGTGTLKGPLTNEEFPKCKELGIKLVQRYKSLKII